MIRYICKEQIHNQQKRKPNDKNQRNIRCRCNEAHQEKKREDGIQHEFLSNNSVPTHSQEVLFVLKFETKHQVYESKCGLRHSKQPNLAHIVTRRAEHTADPARDAKKRKGKTIKFVTEFRRKRERKAPKSGHAFHETNQMKNQQTFRKVTLMKYHLLLLLPQLQVGIYHR